MEKTKHKPTIAIFCRTLEENDDPFSEDYYWQAYQDFMLAMRERGVEPYLVTDNDSYLGDGVFSIAYTIDGKRRLTDLIKQENVKIDVVFDRADFAGTDVLVINNPYLYKVGMDKIEMYKALSEFQPKSFVADNYQQVIDATSILDGEMFVIKEPVSYGGHHVYFATKQNLREKVPEKYPLLVQEFLDTSMGVPGGESGVHDMRLSLCGGELIGCYIRMAKPGKLHSNVSQGGKMSFMSPDEAPKEVVNMALKIDAVFSDSPRYYAADFIYTEKGWKLLEINPQLALLPVTDGYEATQTLTKLADYMATVCKEIFEKSI